MNHHELVKIFQQTFEDGKLNSTERKALLDVMRDMRIEKEQQDFLVSSTYDIALQGLGKGNDAEVLKWLRRTNALIMDVQNSPARKAVTAFSPGPDCLGTIQREISFAETAIDVCVFTISDDRISTMLIDKHKRGLKIRVLTDNDKQYDQGSDIEKIAGAGIPVKVDRSESHMHHKFAIFDRESLLTGSYNWTRSAEAYNQENVLVTYAPHVVSDFQYCFDDLWKKMENY